MARPLFEIWEEPNSRDPLFPWCVQLVNYVGRFRSRPAAESFAESTKVVRAQDAKRIK